MPELTIPPLRRTRTANGLIFSDAVRQGRTCSQPVAPTGSSGSAIDWYIEPRQHNGDTVPVTELVPAPMKARVLSTDSGTTSDKVVPPKPPPGYYVIVGCGAAAVVNHSTLRQSQAGWDRIGDLPVIHVGFDDPWKHYRDHDMGQFANLLHLPGYRRDPTINKEDQTLPRRAERFAADTAEEWKQLGRDFPFGLVRAWVALIQPRGGTFTDTKARKALSDLGVNLDLLNLPYGDTYPPLRLLVVDEGGVSRLIYAAKVDLCVGNGRARISVPKRDDKTDLYGAKCWEPPERWTKDLITRRILSGQEALFRQTTWSKFERVCVMGSGGIGVNMIEIAHETGSVWADWLATQSPHRDAFFNPRNDPLLKAVYDPDPPSSFSASALKSLAASATAPLAMDGMPTGKRLQVNPVLVPARETWRFAQRVYTGVAEPCESPYGVKVYLERAPDDPKSPDQAGLPTRMIDSWGNAIEISKVTAKDYGVFAYSTEYREAYTRGMAQSENDKRIREPEHYHRLILCSGLNFDTVGTPFHVTPLLTKTAPITGPDSRLVGLSLQDGAVRVLGGASTANAKFIDLFTGGKTALEALQRFAGTVPGQAGSKDNLALFALNMLNVAVANTFFVTSDPNYNVNLMTETELGTRLGNTSWAAQICAKRPGTASGFRSADDLCTQVWGTTVPTGARDALKKVSFTYYAPKT